MPARIKNHPLQNKDRSPKETETGFEKNGFAENRGRLPTIVNKTDQARVQFTSQSSVAQVVGERKE